MTFAIEARNLSKRYGDIEAVSDLSFQIHPGEVVGFLGPNGAGKTTTMRMLTGFLPASNGTAHIAGHEIFADPMAARRAIGYLPESPPLYPEMKVESYLQFVARLKDVPGNQLADAVEMAVTRCGLGDVRGRVIADLSKGFRQRVGLAQAIVHSPQVLILDEPTVGLDPIQIREIRGLIHDLASAEDGGVRHTVVLSTHILTEVEAICQRIILINRGRKALDQSMKKLVASGETLETVFGRVTARDFEHPEEDAASGEVSA
jgi:ABC-2 type transport system ATP-binding protein